VQEAETILNVIQDRGRRGLPLENVYRLLYNPDLYLMAYSRLYRNQGAMTKGATDETADGMSRAKIDAIIEKVRYERYRWTPVRRVQIPKRNGKTRPLGVPSWSDKLLQEVLRLILDSYFEPQFTDHSHGFRPGRGCHTALRDITRNAGKGAKWYIEGDIKGCFDNIDHEILLSILREKIHDNRLTRMIGYLLKAGYLENWRYHPSLSGTPQGGIISPVLANIYLDQLDKFVENTLKPKYTRGKERKINPEWNKAKSKENYYKRTGRPDKARVWRKLSQQLPRNDVNDPHFRRLNFVRYADDFLICFAGPKDEAKAIKEEIKTFLQDTLQLELSEEKTLVTHARTQPARFLGYEIISQHCDTKLDRNGTRSINGVLALRVPSAVIREKCARYMKKGKPFHRAEVTPESDFDIVQEYQRQYAGVVNYYLLAQNIGSFARLRWIMESSLLKTLANKHKASVNELWKKHRDTVLTPHGPRRCLTVRHGQPGKRTLTARFGGIPLRRQMNAYIKDFDPTRRKPHRTELIQRLLADECELCKATGNVEVHHVRKLANVQKPGRKAIPLWKEVMIARRRKTLVICRECHQAIHAGKPTKQLVLSGVTGEPDDAKVSRPVRWGADGKGSG
jgi:group II intron reverse transcriptase/maturase